MIVEEGGAAPVSATPCRGLPLCPHPPGLPRSCRPCTLSCLPDQPPLSPHSLSSLRGPGRIGEPCTGCRAVSAARRGLPRPGRCERGPNLRFTLNPQNSPELAKCSIRQSSIDRAADRCAAAVGWGRRSEQTLPSVPSAWDGAEEWRRGARPLGSLRPHTAFQATPPGSGT